MTDKVNPPAKRKYDASQRQAAAAETRAAILTAARELFLGRGYAGTTMSAIATAARVAIDTVYASVGPKPELFRLLIETAISGASAPVTAEERDYVQAIRAESNPVAKIQLYAEAIGVIQARLAPLFRVLQEAARVEPELATLWTEIADRRAVNMRRFVADVIGPEAPLPNGLTLDEAADLVWATNGPELYLLLVEDRGWPVERYTRRLSELWTSLLLP